MGKITINAQTQVENLKTKVTMDEEATIRELIIKVAPEFNLNPGNSVIMFRGEVVPPDKTLKEADIQDGFAVLILPKSLPKSITVAIRNVLGGDQASVGIEPDATVRHVLEEAASELNLDDMTRIIPIYNGNPLSLDQTLERAGIKNDSIIILTPQMEELPETPPQVSQPVTPSQEGPRTQGSRTITHADEKFLREMLGEYKAKNDSLEQKIQKNFLIPKKVAYVLVVVAIISAILILLWHYLSTIMT